MSEDLAARLREACARKQLRLHGEVEVLNCVSCGARCLGGVHYRYREGGREGPFCWDHSGLYDERHELQEG